MTVHLSNRSPLSPWRGLGVVCSPSKAREMIVDPSFICLFVCLFIQLLVRLSFVRPLVRSFVRSFVYLFVCLFVHLFTLQERRGWCPVLQPQQQSPPS